MTCENKITLKVNYTDGREYVLDFDNLKAAEAFFKHEYLRYGVALITFESMEDFEETDFDAFFYDIEEENDPERMELYGEHIKVWKKASSDELELFKESVECFNSYYCYEMNFDPQITVIENGKT